MNELFEPSQVGLTITTWDDLPDGPTGARCRKCDRPLRSPESRDSGLGPCCAAKIGRAVTARANGAVGAA